MTEDRLTFGIRLGDCAKIAPEQIRALAEASSSLCLDSLWFPEHYLPVSGYFPSLTRDTNLDPFELIAYVAEVSGRMKLGTAVALAPFHHPVQLSKRLRTLVHLTGCRIVLGLGVGWAQEEFRAFDVDTQTRGQRTDDLISSLEKLLAGDSVEVNRPYYRLKVGEQPVQPISVPIWGSGGSMPSQYMSVGHSQMPASVARRLAQLDGWITRPTTTPQTLRYDRELIAEHRPTQTAPKFTIANVNFGLISTHERPLSKRTIEELYAAHFGPLSYREILLTTYLVGDPDSITEKLCALSEAGANHFICHLLHPTVDQVEAWAAIAERMS